MIERIVKRSAIVAIITHSSYNQTAMRSSKFWLQQISNIISIRGKLVASKNFEENSVVTTTYPKYNEGDIIEASYGTEWFKANIISIITNETDVYYKIH